MSYALGFISDTHVNVSANTANVITCLEWLVAKSPTMVALLCGGDMSDNPTDATLFSDWIRDPAGGNLAESIPTIMTLGNWDADKSSDPGNYGTIVDPPFSYTTALYGSLFGGAEYFSWTYGTHFLVGSMNTNADALSNAGNSAYFNCNPPGANALNADHTGLSIAGSAQRSWLSGLFDQRYRWKIAMGHRSLWAPYDYDLRKLNRDARSALATPMDDGLALVFTGDIHVGSLSGPWYPAGGPVGDETALFVTAPGKGAYSLTLSGGYAVRQVDDTVLPNHATTCLWSSGGTAVSGIVQVAHIDFGLTQAAITIFEASNANPTGSVVYTGTLYRNPEGLPMSYSTAAVIRQIEAAFTNSTDFPDDTLIGWGDSGADPIIDARLKAAGYSTPLSTVPSLITYIASCLAAALGLDSKMGRMTGAGVERAQQLRAVAMDLLDRIGKGELDIGVTRSTTGEPIVYSDDPEEMATDSAIVGDEWQWEWPAQSRQS